MPAESPLIAATVLICVVVMVCSALYCVAW